MVLTTADLATPWSSRIAVEAQVDCLLASAAHKGASWQGSQNHCRLQKGQPRIVSDPLHTNSGRHALFTPVRRRQGILPAVLSQCLALMHGILRPVPASQVMPVAGVDVATPDGAAPLLKALQGQHVSYISHLLAIILLQCMPSVGDEGSTACIKTLSPVGLSQSTAHMSTLIVVVHEFMLWQLTVLLCADLSALPGRRLSALRQVWRP